ncbi:FkbM family methyltransferase [Ilumatobacter sp.]|uniref:FkbM family methyltransferase n=1 Tax=Ilumatobacter sp. TaxID=1967498 RepID=UPI003B52F72C
MPLFIPLPPSRRRGGPSHVDVVDGSSTAVQRMLRREGLAGYEPSTIATFLALCEMQEDGFAFFDVGANVGLYSVLCSSLFSPGAVVAFEPTPETARIARVIERVNGLGYAVVESALGREPGTAKLHLSAKSDASNSMVEGFKASTGTVDVDVTTMDDHVARSSIAPSVVKIDVETFEPDVVAGAVGTLRRHRPSVIVEVLHRRGHDHGIELTAALDGLGYRYHRISPYSEWDPEPVISGDPEGVHCDWLLTADPLPDDFIERVERWERALAACDSSRNRSTPVPSDLDRIAAAGRTVAGIARRRARRLLDRG